MTASQIDAASQKTPVSQATRRREGKPAREPKIVPAPVLGGQQEAVRISGQLTSSSYVK
jgi:hypothetical protein